MAMGNRGKVTEKGSYYRLPVVATRPGLLKYNKSGKYGWMFCS